MSFLSHLHRDIRSTRLSMRGATAKASDVPIGRHKVYERMKKLVLPEPEHLPFALSTALETRQSAEGGDPTISPSVADLGTLFGLALRKRKGSHHRNYPSGGALYPVETYLICNGIDTFAPGVLHYNPTEHSFEYLWEIPLHLTIKNYAPKPPHLPFWGLVIFTAIWQRSSAKYGDLTYSHALLEAGHMSENILLVSTALDIACRPMAGFRDDLIIKLLDIHEDQEQPIHAITLCKSARSSTIQTIDVARDDV